MPAYTPRRPASRLQPWRPARLAAGYTLLEILVAVLVLSLGVFGAMGMQATALASNRQAQLQSTAVLLGRDLADRMRANKDEAVKANNNAYLTDTRFGATWTAPSAKNCITNTCNTGEMAAWDMRDWLMRVHGAASGTQLAARPNPAGLPGARVVVCYDTAPFDGDGNPMWDCTAPAPGTFGTGYIKLGWNRNVYRSGDGDVIDAASRPGIVIPVIAGNTL